MNRLIFLIGFIIAFVGFAMAALGLVLNSTNAVNSYFVGRIIIVIASTFVAIYGPSHI